MRSHYTIKPIVPPVPIDIRLYDDVKFEHDTKCNKIFTIVDEDTNKNKNENQQKQKQKHTEK